jgi:hypothetical protein
MHQNYRLPFSYSKNSKATISILIASYPASHFLGTSPWDIRETVHFEGRGWRGPEGLLFKLWGCILPYVLRSSPPPPPHITI